VKVALINGSPKAADSASAVILKYLQPLLEQAGHEVVGFSFTKPQLGSEVAAGLSACDVLIFALPLYVDGLPSHVASCLQELEKRRAELKTETRVYAVVNCGFHEGHHARWALRMLRNWCARVGLRWGFGIGFGGGGALSAVSNIPLGDGPTKNLAQALRELVENLTAHSEREDVFTSANIPRRWYKLAAEVGWLMAARANGVRLRDLSKGRG